MAYFQVPWATKHGAVQTFGVEAAIVAALFVIVVPGLQLQGRYLRVSSYIHQNIVLTHGGHSTNIHSRPERGLDREMRGSGVKRLVGSLSRSSSLITYLEIA